MTAPAIARTLPASPPSTILALVSIATVAVIHALAADRIDPLRQTMSRYGIDDGTRVLFAVACVALAGAVGLVGRTLAPIGRIAAYGAALLLVIVVLCPTDAPGLPISTVGQIHRYAAGAAFVLLGVTIAAALTGRSCVVVHISRAALVIAAVCLLITIVATFAPDLASIGEFRGVPQRVMLFDYAGAVGVLGASNPARVAALTISGVRGIAVHTAG